jgi:hypothetical protein
MVTEPGETKHNADGVPPEVVNPGMGQEKAEVTEVLPKITHFAQSVPEAVSAMAVARSRGIGADALQLASAYMGEVRGEIADLRSQLRDARENVGVLGDKLRIAEIDNARLSSQAAGQRTIDNIFKCIGIAAAALIGVGTDLFKGGANLESLGLILIGCGVLGLAASGWSIVGQKLK